MATISQLFVELKLSAENFNNGLKEAQREAKEFEKNLKPTLTATKELGVVMAAAGTAIVGSFTAMSKAAIDYGDKLNDARQRTGRTVEELAKLGFAAEQSGSSFEDLSRGLAFLAKNTKATTQDLNVIADAFAAMEDGPQKAKLAFDLFGKSGQALIPLLNEGSAGIRKLGDDATKAGLVISQDFASASDQLNDSLNEVKASALGVSVGIAQALLPTLQAIVSAAADAAARFAAFSKEHPVLIQATAALGAALLAAGSALVAIAVVIPKVQAGFALVQAAAAALGVSISAATLGVAALGAAIGVIIGQFINWAIEGTKVQRWLDGFIDGSLKKLGFQWNSTSEAQKSAAFTANAVAKAQKELNTEIDKTVFVGPKLVTLVKDQVKAEKTHKESLDKSTKAVADLHAEMMKIQTPLGDWADDVHEYGDEWRNLYQILRVTAPVIAFVDEDFSTFQETVREAIDDIGNLDNSLGGLNQSLRDVLIKDPGVKIADGMKQANEETVKFKSSFDDVKRTAANVFQEMFRDGEISFTKLGNILKGVFETAASEILATMTAKLITPLVDKITGALSGILSKIPGLGGVFGGAASAAGGAASAGGGAVSTAGGIAGGATGILGGVIGGGISALGSLLGSARLEGTMNAVEFNTRATMIEIADMMELILQPMKARIEDILAEVYNHKYIPDAIGFWGEAIVNAIRGGPNGGNGTSGTSNSFAINVYQNSGEDGYSFAIRVADMLNRYVEHSGGRLIASGVKI